MSISELTDSLKTATQKIVRVRHFFITFSLTLWKFFHIWFEKVMSPSFWLFFDPGSFWLEYVFLSKTVFTDLQIFYFSQNFSKKILCASTWNHVYKPLKLSDIFGKISNFREKCEKCVKIFLKFSKMFFNHKMIILYHISHIRYV